MRPRFLISILIVMFAILTIVFWFRPAKEAVMAEPKQNAVQPAANAPALARGGGQNVLNPALAAAQPLTNSGQAMSDEEKK
jgi:hypothetical protein